MIDSGAAAAAVFLDKDGTLIHDVPFNVDPALIRLRDDASDALLALQNAGYLLLLVSNQAGVATGRYEESALGQVWDSLKAELGVGGVALDGIYYCPHGADGNCDCRKPEPGMLRQAAEEHGIDLEASWMVGDILDDVEAGRRAGCRTILLDVGSETEWREGEWRKPHFVADSLSSAARHILAADGKLEPHLERLP
jgi:histidinol-phosphate phosphatase family protein